MQKDVCSKLQWKLARFISIAWKEEIDDFMSDLKKLLFIKLAVLKFYLDRMKKHIILIYDSAMVIVIEKRFIYNYKPLEQKYHCQCLHQFVRTG